MARSQQVVISLLIGYLMGCISPAYLAGMRRGYDVRATGSGNAGASNTFIMAGKRAGGLVAVFDILKATTSWYISASLFPRLSTAGMLGGVACIMGHMFPANLRFKGGKGLACTGGVVLAYSPKAFVLLLAIAFVIADVSRYICVATVAISVIWPMYFGLSTGFWLGAMILAVPAVPVFCKHMVNFRRIAAGEEMRFSVLWNREAELERLGIEE